MATQDAAPGHVRRLERIRHLGIYRRGSRYVVIFRDPAGRQRKRSAQTLAEARALKASLATDVARGDYRDVSDVRFDEYAREWCRTYQGRTGRGIRETTVEEYRRDLELDVIRSSAGCASPRSSPATSSRSRRRSPTAASRRPPSGR